MLADLLALAVVAAYAVRGYMRGLIVILLRLIVVAVSFFAAWLFGGLAASAMKSLFGLSSPVACVCGALFVYFLVNITLSILVYVLRRRAKAKDAQSGVKREYPKADKAWGAVLGGFMGVLAAAVLIWLYNLAGVTPLGKTWPDVRNTVAGRLSSAIVRPVAYLFARGATSDAGLARIIAQAASNPRAAAEDIQRITQNAEVAALVQDTQFTDAVLNSDKDSILKNPRLNRLLEDPQFVGSIRNLGLLRPQSEAPDTSQEVAEQLALVGRNITRIKNDPEVLNILKDTSVKEMVDKRDFGRLLQDERGQKLAERVMQIIKTDKPRSLAH